MHSYLHMYMLMHVIRVREREKQLEIDSARWDTGVQQSDGWCSRIIQQGRSSRR